MLVEMHSQNLLVGRLVSIEDLAERRAVPRVGDDGAESAVENLATGVREALAGRHERPAAEVELLEALVVVDIGRGWRASERS